MFKLIPYRKNNLSRTEDIFDDFFDSFFNDSFFTPMRSMENRFGGFKVDVSDKGDTYLIEADLPGVDKENVKIEYENKYLTISARREETQETKDSSYVRRERQCGEYRRSFFIDNIQSEDIEATFRNGVLKIELKKRPQLTESSRYIEIKD